MRTADGITAAVVARSVLFNLLFYLNLIVLLLLAIGTTATIGQPTPTWRK